MLEFLFGTTDRYEKTLLEQLKIRAQAGLEQLKKESAYRDMQKSIDYINGGQAMPRSKALSSIYDNKLRKIVLEIVSALTDVRPVWQYETNNAQYAQQAAILSKLARSWWRNSAATRSLQQILTYACVGGSGYGYLQWDADKDDFILYAVDPRDVIPLDPIPGGTVQDWAGAVIRKKMSVDDFCVKWPTKAHTVRQATTNSWFPVGEKTSGTVTAQGQVRGVFDIIRNGLTLSSSVSTVDVMTVFVKDHSVNTGSTPVVIGPSGAPWSYTVFPLGSVHPERGAEGESVTSEEARLYPNGRMIICTGSDILEDHPNPYWHGKTPLIQLTLDQMPWSILGSAVISDLLPLQDALNESLRGWDDAIGQWIRRPVIGDRAALGRTNLEEVDTRRGGLRLMANTQIGQPLSILDGPTLPQSYLAFPEFLLRELEENSGVRGLRELSQLKQMPSADTIEQYKEALSPLLKHRSLNIETALAELAEMLKSGFFQYYSAPRRMQILGNDGITLEDFDFAPGSLVPFGNGHIMDRLKKHHKNFRFSVAPHSFLSLSHTMQKLTMMQLFQRQGIDIYTLWKSMDISDIGEPPAESVQGRMIWARQQGLQPGPTPELVQAQLTAAIAGAKAQEAQAAAAVAQLQQQMNAPPQVGPVNSESGIAEPRNDGVGPQGGRPPSGEAMPQLVPRDGGTRMVMSESGR